MTLARLVMPALRASADGAFVHEGERITQAIELGVGGFIIFGGTPEAVRRLTRDLVERAGRPLLIGSDLERGAGQQFAGLTEFPPPRALAALDDLDDIATAASVTAREARSLGINWVFAPDADLDILPENPIVQTRSFGDDPARVADCVRVWVEACQSAGALACAKHYPGHGRTATDSHAGLPVVRASAATLAGSDGMPFDAAIGARVASIMTAHVAYPALDPTGAPATRSRSILGALREGKRFDGLIVTDALIMEGATAGVSEAEGVVEAIAAGVDILLYPHDVVAVVAALDAASSTGRLPAARVAGALARYGQALARVARPTEPAVPATEAARSMADRLLMHGVIGGVLPPLRAPIELVVVDDDLGGPYPPGPSDLVDRALEAEGLTGAGGSRIALVFAEPRAWKGRAGLGAASRAQLQELGGADLIVLFGHPRLAAELPAGVPVLIAWHRQRLMQDAVARWISRQSPRAAARRG
ncbi:MAG: glycoside hydrolase family 3 N-terminal domain-containing protein [Bacillota bacterium]